MTDKNKKAIRTDYQAIFEKAYQLMDEPIIAGNCGECCGYHCCRRIDADGKRLGMYLLPLEYEYMQAEVVTDYELHRHLQYDIPPKIKKAYYIYCHLAEGCLRDYRPIQCRTYPFEPHLENGEFAILIEKAQIHSCVLIERMPEWRQAFIDGVYQGWLELLKIPIIKYHIDYFSKERIALSMDDYFVNREKTPLTEDGKPDFDCLEALDLPYLQQQLKELIDGKIIETPIYDFKTGRRSAQTRRLQVGPDEILVVEGIHALNPVLFMGSTGTCCLRSTSLAFSIKFRPREQGVEVGSATDQAHCQRRPIPRDASRGYPRSVGKCPAWRVSKRL